MNNILSLEDYLFENESPIFFTNEQINESLEYISSEDPALMEAWYNTVLDFAALIPGVGSVAEGINLVSYAKQGQYLLAGLCAIGLIPIFGQYIGAGGTLLVKALGKGKTLGATILKPLINLVAKFFPKIVGFLKSSKFLTKFSGIGPFVGKIIGSLKNFVVKGGSKLTALAGNPSTVKELTKSVTVYLLSIKYQFPKMLIWLIKELHLKIYDLIRIQKYLKQRWLRIGKDIYKNYKPRISPGFFV